MVAASTSAQRYNPELPWGSHGATETPQGAYNPAIPQLGDQLRHLRQLVLSQLAELATAPESDSFVRDEEGYEPEVEGSAAGGAGGAMRPGGPHYPPGTWSDDEDHGSWGGPSELGSGQEGSGDEGSPVGEFKVHYNRLITSVRTFGPLLGPVGGRLALGVGEGDQCTRISLCQTWRLESGLEPNLSWTPYTPLSPEYGLAGWLH